MVGGAGAAGIHGGFERPTTSSSQSRPTSSYRIGRADFASSLGSAALPRPSIAASGAEVLSLDSMSLSSSMPCGGAAAASISSHASSMQVEPKENVMPQQSKAQPQQPQPHHLQPPPTPPPPTPPPQQQRSRDAQPTAGDAAAWWRETEGLLDALDPDGALDALNKTCDALWERLRPPAGPDGPPSGGGSALGEVELGQRRERILGAVAQLMDRREPQLLLRLCRLLLGVRGTERNAQLGAAKLLFKLSKSESNDRRFREYGLLVILLETLAAAATSAAEGGEEEPETLLYAAAALKNTSADAANQKALVALGAVKVLSGALRGECAKLAQLQAAAAASASSSSSSVKGVKPSHVLVQLTATLRNVAVSGSSRKQFVSSGCVEELCGVLRVAPQHADLCLNVSRVLAKLSLHEDVRCRIDSHRAHLDALLHALTLHGASSAPLLIRLCFILGNLSAANEENRGAIAAAALPLLLRLLDECTSSAALASLAAAARPPPPPRTARPRLRTRERRPPPPPPRRARAAAAAESASTAVAAERGSGGEDGGAAGGRAERIDVLVKLIRLVAHLAISPDSGVAIASSAASLGLLRTLQAFTMEGAEELQLNAVSAVTNITYYLVGPSHLLKAHESLCAALVPVLVFPNTEGMVEAARALGNLSRLPDARQTICKGRVHEALLMLLDHSSSAVAEAACGALINLAADLATRHLLLGAHAAPRLADLVLLLLTPRVSREAVGRSDIGAALLATKTLCNLCCTCETASPLSAREVRALSEALDDPRVASSWAAVADAEELRAEWPQATRLFGDLLSRLKPLAEAEEAELLGAGHFAEEQEDYEELEELPVS